MGKETYLYGCEAEPWVKAKVFFQFKVYKKRVYFSTSVLNRLAFLFQRTTPLCDRRVIRLPEGWTRQSCYTWHGCKFIVQETFLPAFEAF